TQSVEVARQSVDLAEQLVKDNQTRVEVGTLAPIDVVQAQSQAATARQSLAQAEGTKRTTEIALKQLIVSGTQDSTWNASITPTDHPDFVSVEIDIPGAVRRALDTRTDLLQVRKNLQVNDVTMKYLHDLTLPQADVVASYGWQGRGGTTLERQPGTIGGAVTNTIPGGYLDALSTIGSRDYPTWNIALNVTYPLGTSAADANIARARVQQQQVEIQLKQIELQVATDITNAAIQVMSNAESVQAAQAATKLAQQQFEAEESKFEVGMSTNYLVVQAQRDLATAKNTELSAVLNYRRSQVEFERLQQTTLSSANITLVGR
ncbi:MAG: TolC family protein, partial [Acidobacteriaceae bacterium]|nr:TolC family protein [Acidobacteriaceae bacterium]